MAVCHKHASIELLVHHDLFFKTKQKMNGKYLKIIFLTFEAQPQEKRFFRIYAKWILCQTAFCQAACQMVDTQTFTIS